MSESEYHAVVIARFDAVNARLDSINAIQEERRAHLDATVRGLADDMWGKNGTPGVKIDVDRAKEDILRIKASEKTRQQITLGTVTALIGLIAHSIWNLITNKP